MLMKVFVWLIRLSGLLALILGLLVWSGNGKGLVPLHMLTGLVLTISLLVAGVLIGVGKGGNIGLMIGAVLLAGAILYLGISQSTLFIGSFHWVVQVVHMLLGIFAVIYAQIILKQYSKSRQVAIIKAA